ncbi:MAG: extracellular solute-binding protein [Clostridiaceae bacterium]|nr:extracellular solute-binding protein [Clostridiaceae bacterium]
MCWEFFNWLIQSSLKASLIILIVILLRKFFKDKINARWYMVLWTIVTIRLILPWAPQTNTSMFNIFDIPANTIQSAIIASESVENAIEKSKAYIRKLQYNEPGYSEENSGQNRDMHYNNMHTDTHIDSRSSEASAASEVIDSRLSISGHNISYQPKTPLILYLFVILWAIGLLAFYSCIVFYNIKFYRKITDKKLIVDERICHVAELCRKQLNIRKPVMLYETGAVEEPCIYGLFNPVILIPKNMISMLSDSEFWCILIHEFTHYRKKDNILNLLSMVISGLHWFNPLVHIAFSMMRHDNELLCDSQVLRHMSGDKYTYGRTLLKLACSTGSNGLVISSGMVVNGKRLKDRIKRIAGVAGHKLGWSIIAILMVIIVGCTGLSNEKKTDEPYMAVSFEPVNIHFYTRGYNNNTPENEMEDILMEISKKLEDSLKITPVFHWIPYEEYEDKLKKLINSGEAVDAFTSYETREHVQEGIAMDISVLFPQYAPKYYEQLKSTEAGQILLKSVTVNGRQYMIPWNYFDCPRACIVARKDLVSKYSANGFKTLEKYGNFLKEVKENEQGVLPGFVYSSKFFDVYIKGNGYYSNFASWFYSKITSKQLSVYPIVDLSEFIDSYNLLKNWKDNGYVVEDVSKFDYYTRLHSGELASLLLAIRDINDYFKLASPGKFEYGIYPLYMDSTHELPVYSQGLVISKYSKNPERVLMFVEWLHSSQENYDLFMYGIQDKNYELAGDSIYFPSNAAPLQKWSLMGAEFFKNCKFERSSLVETNEYRKVLLDASLKNVITSEELMMETYGMSADELIEDFIKDKEWQEEISNMQKYLDGILDKYYDNMVKFFEYIDSGHFVITPEELREKQKEAGVDKIVEYYGKLNERYGR